MMSQQFSTRQERQQEMKRMMDARNPQTPLATATVRMEPTRIQPSSRAIPISRHERQQQFAKMMARKPSRIYSTVVQATETQERDSSVHPSGIVNVITRHERQQEFARMMTNRFTTLVDNAGQKRAREELDVPIQEVPRKQIKKSTSSCALYNEQAQDNIGFVREIVSSVAC
eukprot:CAMPEP_0177711374 /NCGR_PEP_ID=MMETSP0484_2-20121128/11829_1 /TAXON_ID=354590 /ORGANISM="Rhodomonas lens, Strain RHODO" /LENGTH=171 /DNA_ID=CAMNT_0019223107 /DNA_START=97 /DNA_END=612 /DNA_ORIENTATION=-